jgi:hypothetical protein
MTLRLVVYACVAAAALVPFSGDAAPPTYQGALAAKIAGPRKIASTPDGELFVVDVAGRLQRLTRRGELVAPVLQGVVAVAAAPGAVFAARKDGAVIQVNPRTGRAVRRVDLGTADPAAALAYDAARGKLWIVFASGSIQARTLDGAVVHDLAPGAGGSYRLAGITVDPAGTVWVIQDRTGNGATMHGYDAATGAFLRSVPAAVSIAGGLSAAGGQLYVSDVFSGKVQIVASDGTSAGSVGTRGTAAGQLNQPTAVSFLANGDLVVANMDSNRLDRFGDGTPLPSCTGDADCDGLSDAWETANGLDPNDPSNALADRDGDGLNDTEELAHGADPRSRDTDGDGFDDGDEVASGFDPRDGTDHRPQILGESTVESDPGLVRLAATVHDPVGGRGACTARWRQVSGVPVTLKGATTMSPSFVARKAGAYRFEANATCGTATSLPKQVDVAVANVAPRADGGRLVTLAAGGALQLSGRFTVDGNGDAVQLQWDQVGGPAVVGSVAGTTLSAAISEPGTYVFRLAAKDAGGAEGSVEVPVVVVGSVAPPVAAVSSPVAGSAGQAVTLDASASHRSAAATFSWRQVAGAAVSLQSASSATPSFVPEAPGRYAFEVALADGGLSSPAARVEVYVAPAGGALPVAVAAAPRVVAVDAAVALDGSASTGALTFAWRQVSGPAAGLTRADRASANAVLFEPGSYEFELTVSDAAAVGVPARVRIEARSKSRPIPAAVVTAPATAVAGDLVLLDGRASTGATRYRWTQVSGPWVAVEQGAVASFHAVAPGTYVFQLEVDDGAVRSAPAQVSVVVTPNGTEN